MESTKTLKEKIYRNQTCIDYIYVETLVETKGYFLKVLENIGFESHRL